MTQRFIPVEGYAGGGVIGYVTCSYADLVKVFGEPTVTDGYKTSSEWTIKDTKTGVTFSIYDYKVTELYSRGLPTVEAFRAMPSYRWHVGSVGKVHIDALEQFVKERTSE